MAKKPTISARNKAMLDKLTSQKVYGGKEVGYLKPDLKRFIAESLIKKFNNNNKLITSTDTLQKEYERHELFYSSFFVQGVRGHGYYPSVIANYAKRDIREGTKYYIKRGDQPEKEVSYSQLAYEMELLSYKLSSQHDVPFTKFHPVYKFLGNGKHKVIITIPDLKEIDFDEMTVEEIVDYLDENNVEIIVSEPGSFKSDADRKAYFAKKKKVQKAIKERKEKYYAIWKGKKRKK